MPPKTVTWTLDEHTLGKHLVLRAYLDAWLPIMSRFNGRILFIDGFAGPGEYAKGEDGSPIIALKALVEHSAKTRIVAEIGFVFIEEDKKRVDHLGKAIGRVGSLPPNCHVNVFHGRFDQTLSGILDDVDRQAAHLAPSLVMIDPFGVSGTPMDVVRRIFASPKSEVLVSLMYEPLNRFLQTPEYESHLDDLFGSREWRQALQIVQPEQRRNFIYGLYSDQLRNAGAKYVVWFELYEGNRHVYTMFFATQHRVGCDRMKQAIWKTAPLGNYQFRSNLRNHMALLSPDFEPLKEALIQEFSGRGWIDIGQVSDFVASDKTNYHSGQLKSKALKPLEQEGKLEIDTATRRRNLTYPDGVRLKFL
ncbi:MAG TPA: three-Cys-motif partner protein TcmP [Planctomycetaceae bacterium]|nr:three-Cys-motif partner protein TcmP [Planctomycetaceae bacterium]